MTAQITAEGTYKLIRSTEGNQILALDGQKLQLVHGPRGEVLVGRHGDFQTDNVLERGRFKFIEFDPQNGEEHRLLLERQGDFRVVLFAEGLPEGPNDKVRCRISEEVVAIDEVKVYLASLRSAVLERRTPTPEKDALAGVRDDRPGIDEQSTEELLERIEAMEPAELHELEDYERRHQQRREVLEAIEKKRSEHSN